jgi:hypothetical protein
LRNGTAPIQWPGEVQLKGGTLIRGLGI